MCVLCLLRALPVFYASCLLHNAVFVAGGLYRFTKSSSLADDDFVIQHALVLSPLRYVRPLEKSAE